MKLVKWEKEKKRQTYPKGESFLHADGVGIIEDGVAKQTKLAARISGPKIVENGRVTNQNIHLSGSVGGKGQKKE